MSRKLKTAYFFMKAVGPRLHHYKELSDVLARISPENFEPTIGNWTPWYTLHRDMSRDLRFVRARDRSGRFCLMEHLPKLVDEESSLFRTMI